MQKTTFHWFGGATTEVSQDQSMRANETYHWANGVTSQVQNDFGNTAAPPASISPIAAAITLAVGEIKTFDELYTITGTTSDDYDVVSDTPATATWGDTTGLTSVKAGTTKVTATGKAGSAADGLSADVDVTVVAALAWGSHPASGTLGTNVNYNFTGGIPLVNGDSYQIIVTKPDGTEHDNVTQTAKTYAMVTAESDAAGTYTVMVFDKGVKPGTTDPVDGGAKISQEVTMAAAPAKTVNGKVLDAQVGGTVVPAASLFTIANGAAYSDILTVTGTPAKVTWDATASTLTIADDATGDIALAYTVKSGVTKGSTAPKLTGVTAKP